MCFVGFTYAPIFGAAGLPLAGAMALPVSALYLLTLWFNRKGYFFLARLWIIASFNLGIAIFAVMLGEISGIHLGVLIVVCLAFLLFTSWRDALLVASIPALSFVGITWVQRVVEPFQKIEPTSGYWLRTLIGATTIALIAAILAYWRLRINRLEEEQRRLIRRRENLLSILSHDIRSPLTVTLATLDAMKSKVPMSAEKMERRLSLARESVIRIERLLGSIRSLLAAQSGKVEMRRDACVLEQLIAELCILYHDNLARKDLRLEVENKLQHSCKILGDPDLLVLSVFGNLLSNAIKFSPRGRSIHICLQLKDEGVCVTVKDEGLGISAELLPHLFSDEHPTTRKGTENEEGTGFGLPLAAEIVKLHGGTIVVESPVKSGEFPGAAFHVTLPEACVA